MAGYQKLRILLTEELDELEEEGRLLERDVFLREIETCGDDRDRLLELYDKLRHLPMRPDFPYQEPSDYEEILAACGEPDRPATLSDEQLRDRMYGAWLGRCIGCAAGQPVEGWKREDIRAWCEGADAYPLAGYIPTHSRAEAAGYALANTACTTEHLQGMPSDDDIRYTILGLDLLKKHGCDFDAWDVGTHWLERLPLRAVCTAETQSYLNFANLDQNGPWKIRPDHAADLARSCANYINPYREWIGAQIRIDAYGYVAAGNPALAAKLAYQDASFSHVKNGIYGAMFFAAFIAAAFSSGSIREAIETARHFVPVRSRFAEIVEQAIAAGESARSEEELLDRALAIGAGYNWVHTLNNAALCVAALVYAEGDLDRAVPLVVMGGMDTDCNGATVGSIVGAFQGAEKISAKWKDPLHDTVLSEVIGYHPIAISELARQTVEVIQARIAR